MPDEQRLAALRRIDRALEREMLLLDAAAYRLLRLEAEERKRAAQGAAPPAESEA